MSEDSSLSSLKANFQLIKAQLHFHTLQLELGKSAPPSFEQTLALFVESVCDETGNTVIVPQQRANELLKDVSKLERCA